MLSLAFYYLIIQTHAEYCDSVYFRDSYTAHRALQAYELSEFIRLTGSGCDAVILAGDLNAQPHELGYKIIKGNAALEDSWTSQVRFVLYYKALFIILWYDMIIHNIRPSL